MMALLGAASSILAAQFRYVFTEGEPLDYQLRVTGQIDSVVTRVLGDKPQSKEHKEKLELTVDCRLVPVVVEADGIAKLRLVVDRIVQNLDQDGDSAVTVLTRAGIQRTQGGQVTERAYFDVEPEPVFGASAPAANVKTVSASELFDQPILLRVAPDGTWREFDDQSLLRKVLPALDLRRCLELIMVRLPTDERQTWSQSVPIDSPGNQKLPEALQNTISYKRDGEKIRLDGAASFDNLQVPIARFEEKWLRWTTYLESVFDSLRGEVEFEDGVIKRAELQSSYRCRTRTARKEDAGRRHALETLASNLRIEFTKTSSLMLVGAANKSERR